MSDRGRVGVGDVAARAKVTASTALRGLHRPEMLRPAARARVEAAARELGYTTDVTPRSAARTRAAIAVVVPDVSSTHYAALCSAITIVGYERGYEIRVLNSDRDPQRESSLVESAVRSADGVVVCAAMGEHPPERLGTPIVSLNRYVNGSNAVLLDQQHVVDIQISHLAELGHEHILWANGALGCWAADVRRRRVAQVAAHHDIRITEPLHPNYAGGARLVDMLTADTTAVVTFNDRQAYGFFHRARERGVRVPEDVSVVSCDGLPGSELSEPRLTTVQTPWLDFARAALGLLAHQAAGGGPVIVETIRGLLVVRESTARSRQAAA